MSRSSGKEDRSGRFLPDIRRSVDLIRIVYYFLTSETRFVILFHKHMVNPIEIITENNRHFNKAMGQIQDMSNCGIEIIHNMSNFLKKMA